VPSLPRQQPFHEPVGLSPEDFASNRRRIVIFVLIAATLGAGLVTLYLLMA
jgi:hypothetical protein